MFLSFIVSSQVLWHIHHCLLSGAACWGAFIGHNWWRQLTLFSWQLFLSPSKKDPELSCEEPFSGLRHCARWGPLPNLAKDAVGKEVLECRVLLRWTLFKGWQLKGRLVSNPLHHQCVYLYDAQLCHLRKAESWGPFPHPDQLPSNQHLLWGHRGVCPDGWRHRITSHQVLYLFPFPEIGRLSHFCA